MRLSNRYTTSYGCRDLVERVTRPLGHPFLQAIEELARTSIEQVLNLLDWNEVLNLKLNHEYGGVPKTGSRAADSARALQQVAMAKLDLNKTQSICGGYGAI
jgi:ABC-type nitrate/sulfonate/bicarbonate transport system ATPase subunit